MWQYLNRLGIAISVLFNVATGGYSNQTFSARNHMWKREGRPNLVWLIDPLALIIAAIINKLFKTNINESNHCLEAWCYWRIRKDVIHDIQTNVIQERIYYGKDKRWKVQRQRFQWSALQRIAENTKRYASRSFRIGKDAE